MIPVWAARQAPLQRLARLPSRRVLRGLDMAGLRAVVLTCGGASPRALTRQGPLQTERRDG